MNAIERKTAAKNEMLRDNPGVRNDRQPANAIHQEVIALRAEHRRLIAEEAQLRWEIGGIEEKMSHALSRRNKGREAQRIMTLGKRDGTEATPSGSFKHWRGVEMKAIRTIRDLDDKLEGAIDRLNLARAKSEHAGRRLRKVEKELLSCG